MSNDDSKEAGFFSLTTDGVFGSRAKDVFSNLEHIEAKHNAYQKARSRSHGGDEDEELLKNDPLEEPAIGPRFDKFSRSNTSSDNYWTKKPTSKTSVGTNKRCTDGEFKKPKLPSKFSRSNKRHADPDKWKFYDLSDVSDDVLSNKSNTATALDFLQSKRQKSTEDTEEMMVTDDHSEAGKLQGWCKPKHIFKKSTPKSDPQDRETSSQSCMGGSGHTSKIVMPEYVIGQKAAKTQTKTTAVKSVSPPSGTCNIVMNYEDGDDDEGSVNFVKKDASSTSEVPAVKFRKVQRRTASIRQSANDKDEELDAVD